jgi:hypothetical protein
MAIEIPLQQNVPHFEERVQLDGEPYTLEFRWNEREGSWRFSIGTSEGDPIAVNLKVLPGGQALGARVKDVRMPPGLIAVVDTGGTDTPPGLHDLGARVQIVYFTAEEVAEG